VFDPEDGGNEVPERGQLAVGIGVLVDQQVFQPGLELLDQPGTGGIRSNTSVTADQRWLPL
jgi:hypothetical protein